jgi:nicotinate-nucleotide adenylyltransferase
MKKAKKKKAKKSAAPKRRAKSVARRQKKPARKRARVTARRPARKSAKRRPAPRLQRHPMPPASPGMKIGLFGGSFNPPHEAHRAASMLALKRLGLDRIWWLVTPGNPLKENAKLPPLDKRIEAARKVAASPKIDVTGVEAELGTRYTFDTVTQLRQRRPGVDFVFIVGADNLAHLHRWERWRGLLRKVALAVVDRPEFELSSLAAPAAVAFGQFRITENKARMIPRLSPPAWVFLRGLKSELSSTALRKLKRTKSRKG